MDDYEIRSDLHPLIKLELKNMLLLFCLELLFFKITLKPREDVTGCPKQGYQWPHKEDLNPPKIILKKGRFWNAVLD